MDPAEALERIAFLIELAGEPRYRARVFRRAAGEVAALDPDRLRALADAGELQTLPGVGEVSAKVITEALRGEVPAYIARLEGAGERLGASSPEGAAICGALRGDCHVHSNWSDGRASMREMAEAARDLGHAYIVLTDHSPSLKIANGLSVERLREELDEVAKLNAELAPFRVLTGIEVDILLDGSLDHADEVLSGLDVVVGSVHSKLRMARDEMTARMLRAIADPRLDILGHCTGRMRRRSRGGDRPESEFDADAVFAACAQFDKAVEVNCQPARLDPPRRLIQIAADAGCRFSVDTDAHAPGELAWQPYGCDRLGESAVPPERVVNTLAADNLLAWARSHEARATKRRTR